LRNESQQVYREQRAVLTFLVNLILISRRHFQIFHDATRFEVFVVLSFKQIMIFEFLLLLLLLFFFFFAELQCDNCTAHCLRHLHNSNKTDRRTQNVTLRRVRATTVAVKRQCATNSECVFVTSKRDAVTREWRKLH